MHLITYREETSIKLITRKQALENCYKVLWNISHFDQMQLWSIYDNKNLHLIGNVYVLALINNDGLEIMQAILNPDMLFKF